MDSFSGGQRRRCDIARALVNTPKILFLDEPTTGLDPQTRKAVWETIQTLQKAHGMTVFLTTHYMKKPLMPIMSSFIDNGTIAAKGTSMELCERYAKDRLTLTCPDPEAVRLNG
jgi:multidrug/hemolysin transport system ATP-binding protein